MDLRDPLHTQPHIEQETLDEAAALWRIEPEFWDIWGHHHVTDPATELAILKSLGVDTSGPAALQNAIEERIASEWTTLLPPAVILSRGAREIRVRVPATEAESTATFDIRCESGMAVRFEAQLGPAPVIDRRDIGAQRYCEKRVTLPADVPLGYHQIAARTPGHSATARLIVCPDRAYQPDWLGDRTTAGIGVSLYGLRSGRNWGCGDFTDLERFTSWAASALGVSFIALNPLHAIPNRRPFNISPYLPDCGLYKNFIYLDIERIPDFARSRQAQRLLASDQVRREIACLRDSELVQYERVARLKMAFLKAIFREFLREFPLDTPRAHEFRAYVEREGDLLHAYALHGALDECEHRRDPQVWNWPAWSGGHTEPRSQASREFAAFHWRSVLLRKYIQWQIETQLEAAQVFATKHGMRIGLYHDLALATDRFGCDLWAHRDFYVAGARVGSPPDNFAPKGQDWAFPPPNAIRHYRDGFRLFAELIRKNAQHGGALRIDHVMRFFRLFWIPEGLDAAHGTYVRERYEDLLHIVALESVRERVLVIGEDLGTVPDFIREALARFGVLSYRLFYFEQDSSGRFRRPQEYPRQALVAPSTHDLPTLAGFWQNRDIDARRAVGILPDEQAYRRALDERGREKQKMLDMLFELGLIAPDRPRRAEDYAELTGDLHNAIIGFLASTPSMLLLLDQSDLFKETEQQNLPGTTAEYPNWQRKMRYRIEDLDSNEFTRGCAAMYRGWIERTGRSSA